MCLLLNSRQKRKDFNQDEVKPYVFNHINHDNQSRLNMNQGKVDVVNHGTGNQVSVHKHIWCVINKEQQYLLLLSSNEFA